MRATRLVMDRNGVVSGARQVPSPNVDERPNGARVTLVVVHGISLPPGEFGGDGVEALFTNRLEAAAHPYYATLSDLRVSSHFLIRRDGELVQFAPCDRRAWHAGRSSWRGVERCNDYSIGVELEGTDTLPYTSAQYSMLARVVRLLKRHYGEPDVVGHSDVAPGRKTDPGPSFDWGRLRRLIARRPAAAAR